jgi:hypothetical protein
VTLPEAFRPLPIRGFNAAGRALERTGVRPFRFDPETVLEKARRMTGLDDFGGESFLPGLRRLTQSLEEDAHLHLFGRFFARRQILELLCHRLRLQEHRRRHSEVAEEATPAPLFIVGLPRTGTTLVQGLLSMDPANRSPLSWEVDEPCPPAQSDTYTTDPRIETTERRFEQLRRLAPSFQAIHPIGARMPQECIVLTAPEFLSLRFEMCFDVAGYQEWLPEQDMTGAYRFHRSFLQHLQSRHRAERWVLKSPGHFGCFEALFAVYPDARIIQTHRDPVRIIPSVASLEYSMRQVASDHVDAHRLGRQMLRLWSRLTAQALDFRAKHPEREAQFVDLPMDEITGDPLASVERCYQRFGFPFTAAAEGRMRLYLAAHPKHEFGEHHYTLADFGLDAGEIRASFAPYRERFGVRDEPFSEA